MKFRFLAAILAFSAPAFAEDLSVLPPDPAPGKYLEENLRSRAFAYLDQRKELFEKLSGQTACRNWQQERREFFLKQIGEFPERTPLNARTVGKLSGDGYEIEKVMFESRPNHHVTAALYLPTKTKGPFPAVLIPCGHSHNGKASGQYQRICILLAQNGMAALCYDPIGQGERYQMLDRAKTSPDFLDIGRSLKAPHPSVKYLCTTEHTAMGLGCSLLGTNIAQFRIWDGMRAIDYLQSRDDIIADKIGCTGNSGGGTMTSYLMALDDRIAAAAPGCFLTTFYKLLELRGPQDGEQNIFGQIKFGMNEADYVMMRAPVPILICASTRDSTFDIGGAREVFHQAKRFYSRLGYPNHVALNEADAPHGYYIQHREAVARWMHRWLLGEEKLIWEKPRSEWPEQVTDEFLRSLSEAVWTEEELQCSPEGQVMLMEGERSVFDFNSDSEAALKPKRDEAWAKLSAGEKGNVVKETLGLEESRDVKIESTGTLKRDGYSIEKLILRREGKIPLPALAFLPDAPVATGACLYVHGESKSADAAIGGPIESLVKQGKLVLVPDLSGVGEVMTTKAGFGYGRFGKDVTEIYTAYLMGESYVKLRVEDLQDWSSYFKEVERIELIGIGEAAIPTLHFAALEPGRFSAVTVKNMIHSWSEVVREHDGTNQAVNMVHGALLHYDLPNLVEWTGAKVEKPVSIAWGE